MTNALSCVKGVGWLSKRCPLATSCADFWTTTQTPAYSSGDEDHARCFLMDGILKYGTTGLRANQQEHQSPVICKLGFITLRIALNTERTGWRGCWFMVNRFPINWIISTGTVPTTESTIFAQQRNRRAAQTLASEATTQPASRAYPDIKTALEWRSALLGNGIAVCFEPWKKPSRHAAMPLSKCMAILLQSIEIQRLCRSKFCFM